MPDRIRPHSPKFPIFYPMALLAAGLFSSMALADTPWDDAMRTARLDRADLAIRPDRWETRWPLPFTQDLMRDPADTARASQELFDVLKANHSSADLLRISADRLGVSLSASTLSRSPLTSPALILTEALRQAQRKLNQAVESLTPPERQSVLSAWTAVLQNESDTTQLEAALAPSGRFDQASLLSAALTLAEAADQTLPILSSTSVVSTEKIHVVTGEAVTLDAAALNAAPILLNFSRRTTYTGLPASAGEGQIRLVIDFSEEVVLESTAPLGGAGSGQLGIGLLYLANPKSNITLRTQDLSQGAGVFGVGGLFVNGGKATLEAGRGAQGAGVFGVGLFSSWTRNPSTFSVRLAGQGSGFTRGAGIFIHRGDGSEITGGLTYPDPREDAAFISLCQGVGYGPRAFAAGGVGLALIQGNRNHLRSSYFAQGAGYWMGFGGFYVQGDDNTMMARRYSQGSGVHTALGSMKLTGHRNTTINWGVGPAYGWDYGVGLFEAQGNDNLFRADWATGHGEMNGHGLGRIIGERNRVSLPGFGTGTLTRMAPGYGLASVIGGGSAVLYVGAEHKPLTENQALSFSAWGTLRTGPGVAVEDKFTLPPVDWPKPGNRDSARAAERARQEQTYRQTEQKPPAERWKDWLRVSSDFSLDATIPTVAQQRLMESGSADVEALLALVTSDRFDEFIRLRTVLSGVIRNAEPALSKAYSASEGTRRVILLSLASYGQPEQDPEMLKAALASPDWRLRRGAIGLLGYWHSRDQSASLGREAFYGALVDFLKEPLGGISESRRKTFYESALREKYLTDLLATLALDPKLSAQDRQTVAQAQSDWMGPVSLEGFKAFLTVLGKNQSGYVQAMNREIAGGETSRATWKAAVVAALEDPAPDVIQAAILTLGQWGEAGDADRVASFLQNENGWVREAAATALGKMGTAGTSAIQAALHSSSFTSRSLALVAAAQSGDPTTLRLLEAGLNDPDERLRSTALSSFSAVPAHLQRELRPLRKTLKRLAKTDPSPAVRILAAYYKKIL